MSWLPAMAFSDSCCPTGGGGGGGGGDFASDISYTVNSSPLVLGSLGGGARASCCGQLQ